MDPKTLVQRLPALLSQSCASVVVDPLCILALFQYPLFQFLPLPRQFPDWALGDPQKQPILLLSGNLILN